MYKNVMKALRIYIGSMVSFALHSCSYLMHIRCLIHTAARHGRRGADAPIKAFLNQLISTVNTGILIYFFQQGNGYVPVVAPGSAGSYIQPTWKEVSVNDAGKLSRRQQTYVSCNN